jgi:ribosomal protein S18 acetylase RimI-like enzyme
MSNSQKIDVIPVPIFPVPAVVQGIIQQICSWPFEDSYIPRLLKTDIPQRMQRGKAGFWLYTDGSDPKKEVIGFGTIDVCLDYKYVTGNRYHPHIPLLACRPDMRGKGVGTSIVKHLIGEAVLRSAWPGLNCYPVVFLEVYTDNVGGIRTYQKTGFKNLSDDPTYDAEEKKSYFVMARSLSIAPEQGIG